MRKIVLLISSVLCLFWAIQTHASNFTQDFAWPLVRLWWNGDEKAYDFSIDWNAPILENLKKLFYPSEWAINGWLIWKFIRTIAVALFFALLVYAWFQFIINADNPEWIAKAKMSLLYIILWALLFFLAWRILTKFLNLWGVDWLFEWSEQWSAVADKANSVALLVLSLLKAFAFFLAIFFIARYGFGMVTAVWEDEKIDKARQWIINVIFALIFIKIIDYIYYITVSGDFKNQAIDFIAQASKFLTYLIWAAFVLALLYAWYTMLLSSWDDEKTTKAVNILKAVFIVWLLVMLFMLVIHQVFWDVYW